MLNRVPVAVNFAVRQVVLRHPNSWDCTVLERKVVRNDLDDAELIGGLPTLGGAGVLDSEDETEYEYVERGDARMLLIGPYEPSEMNDRGDAELQRSRTEAQIVCVANPDEPGYFTPQNHDIVIAYPGEGIGLAYEVLQPIGNVNIPPYSVRYVLNPRDDLHYIEPFKSEPAAQPEPDDPVDANTPAG